MRSEAIGTEAFLAHLPLFASLSPDELARIAGDVVQQAARRGSLLFRRGDPCTGFHCIVYGQVKLALRGRSGEEKVVEILGPRQSFGEAVMFLEKPYYVDAEALADSKLLFVPRETIFRALDGDPQLARRMLGALSARLHRLIGDVEAYALQSGRQRVAAYLLNSLPPRTQGPGRVTLPTRKGVIASRLSLTQEHFSRVLRELSDAGLIAVHGREVVIPDLVRLRGDLS